MESKITLISEKEKEILALDSHVRRFAKVQTTKITRANQKKWKRNIKCHGCELHNNFEDIKKTTLTQEEAIVEARRCLKCADAPCTKSCPAQVDIKQFIQCMSTGNFYGAAKMILSENPVGLSCGMVCPVSELCSGACNLSNTSRGAINISGLQHFAVETFMKMKIPQIRDPSLPALDKLPKSFDAKIALIGSGPSCISCGSFLGRLGYKNVTVFEKNAFPGGISSAEIPAFRLPYKAVKWEVKLMEDLGVKIQYNSEFGTEKFNYETLKKDNYEAIFLGVGLPFANYIDAFKDLTEESGFYTSKTFLQKAALASKPGIVQKLEELPKLHGHVIVLGAGDTAMDCCLTAFRCGAERVSLCFRRSTDDMRAVEEELVSVREEGVELIPFSTPNKVDVREGKIFGVEFVRFAKNDKGVYEIDADQKSFVKCDFIVSAFGAQMRDSPFMRALDPLVDFERGLAVVEAETMQSKKNEIVFAGGDIVGSKMTVEASNDGKTAAWGIHRYLQMKYGDKEIANAEPNLPGFFTEVDLVDLSVDVAGLTFPNPFGLASSPPSTTAAMIRRSFEAGWGFAVTKTFALDNNVSTNVSPRITKSADHNLFGPHQQGFLNIELISEKTSEYWCKAIKELKQDFPDRIVIASIMAIYEQTEWEKLAKVSQEYGADALELNLSCPHISGRHGEAFGMTIGTNPEAVEQVCKWVAAAVKIPFFAKLTPNATSVAAIAEAAKKGGATGISGINTVSGVAGIRFDSTGWPAVGKDRSIQKTSYGGVSGNIVRPVALKAISSAYKQISPSPVLGIGGCDSAEAALQYIYAGASVIQFCSSIQNQDYTVVNDYITGLRCLLYMLGRPDLRNSWEFQFQRHRQHVDLSYSKALPRFGDFEIENRKAKKEALKKFSFSDVKFDENEFVELGKVDKIPRINDIVGLTVNRIVGTSQLPSEDVDHVVAFIADETKCINCGKCYLTCADTGYSAIKFDSVTHIPVITDDCTGCGLCYDVCPVTDCISFVPRKKPYSPSRGFPMKDSEWINNEFEKLK
ncbi:dihydropyrimidine dehydrogenase [NADP(+)] [Anaeramoeba ignava]|uniref:dihydropyrimidine dehydrogenase (NADP(+)) n=1 Tax=Anaeramoeba ignava TaxID=1746090 RepID=A0A9Q0L8H2_ANAIG|nr:dihydropyrimidine dehydrogenase [NADP(+)] [Anaeramoeba ignava]